MYDLLKNISTTNNWDFTYAKRDWANLYDEVENGKVKIFLDPVETNYTYGEYNQVYSKTYTGSFLILLSSDIDDGDYEQRYIDYIKPLITGASDTLKNSLLCEEINIGSWREQEVINIFDFNLDGLIVTYSITENV